MHYHKFCFRYHVNPIRAETGKIGKIRGLSTSNYVEIQKHHISTFSTIKKKSFILSAALFFIFSLLLRLAITGAGVFGIRAQFFFDAQNLIILGRTFSAARSASFDLSSRQTDD